MEGDIAKCILFDQDAFRDIRMLSARRRQKNWEREYLPDLSNASKGELLYTRQKLPEALNRNVSIGEEDRAVLTKLWISHLELLGSTQDGLYLEKGFPVYTMQGKTEVNETDLDILFQYTGLNIADDESFEFRAESPGLLLRRSKYPGYVKLKFPHTSSTYFSTKSLKHKLFLDLLASDFYISPNEYQIIGESPALGGCIEDELGIHYLDYVCALKLDFLPDEAQLFLVRESTSGWPSRALKEEALKEGCCLVATGPRQEKTSTALWRLSFAKSENVLVRSLTNFQVRVYLFFKTISKMYLFEPEALSSYMLKNVLLWTLEIIPNDKWREERLIECLEAMFDLLCSYLENKIIPNYFLPQQNLLAGVDQNALAEVVSKLHDIQENVPSYVTKCTESFDFKGYCEFSPTRLSDSSLTETEFDRSALLSEVFFTMCIYIRLQARRYQLQLSLESIGDAFNRKCASLFSAIPPRAGWYLLEAMKRSLDNFRFRCDHGAYVVDTSRARTKIVTFWRDPSYIGIFKRIIEVQEFVTGDSVREIPEFDKLVDWVDMACLFTQQEGIKYNNITHSVILD